MPAASFDELLTVLSEHGVEFIVVGMGSAVLQGVPSTTFDIDIVHRRDPDNVQRLVRALSSVNAYSETIADASRPMNPIYSAPDMRYSKPSSGI